MLNRDLFTLTPQSSNLLNDGVVNINAQEQKIVRYELETFVCEGEYERGLQRILDTYLKHLEKPQQPAVWVSGFFGSGKSHLVKMLGYLWEDFEFLSGDTARTIKQLPTPVNDLFVELGRKQKVQGKLAVIGTLKDFPSPDIRYSFLSLLLKALDLPAQLHLFKFVHWCIKQGIHDALVARMEAEGTTLEEEAQNLSVSPILARAVLELLPSFADSEAQVLDRFESNFRPQSPNEMLSREQLIYTIKKEILPLKFGDKIPCTIIVLDEVQQFIGQDSSRTIEIQNLAQDLCAEFEGKFLLVATGQNALTDTPQLLPLTHRFSVSVLLSDTDVETVTRKTVLHKKASAVVPLNKLLEDRLGEISRNLSGSDFSYSTAERELLSADYPMLPSTRKFWKRILQIIDTAGMDGQLRSQLRIVNDGVNDVAHKPLGHIVPADFVFWQKKAQMSQSPVLLNETLNLIELQKTKGPHGELESRILAVVFLLDLLPDNVPGNKIQADDNTIADLLLDNLNQASDDFREQVKAAIQRLVQQQHLMQIAQEYRLQTKVGAEWQQEYKKHEAKLTNTGGDQIQRELRERIVSFFKERSKAINIVHGTSRVKRDFEIWDQLTTRPTTENRLLYVWIRDGWNDGESLLLNEIRSEGAAVPLSYVYVAKYRDADIRREIVRYLAADHTLKVKANNLSPESEQARRSMATQRGLAHQALQDLIEAACKEAAVYLAGGKKIDTGDVMADVRDALGSLADRQFPEFKAKGDFTGWGAALTKAIGNAPDALAKVGWKNDVKDHPVAVEILRFMGNGTHQGKAIRQHFMKSPYGFEQDAVDTMLLMLRLTDQISTTETTLNQSKISAAEFRKEVHSVEAKDRVKLRQLFASADIKCQSGEELAASGNYLRALLALADRAGGDAPMPAPPNTQALHDLEGREGNERLLGLLEQQAELRQLHADWTQQAATAKQRQPQWQLLADLLRLAPAGSPVIEPIREEAEALRAGRLLLHEPDLVAPLLARLADELKTALTERKQRYIDDYDARMTTLQADPYFTKLAQPQKHDLLSQNQLLAKPELKPLDAAGLLGNLQKASLETWETKLAALPGQFQAVHAAAVKLTQPKAQMYKLPRTTIASRPELEEYLNDLRAELEEMLDNGESVILN